MKNCKRHDTASVLRSQTGFGLIEMVVLIIVVGIMVSMAMQSLTVVVEDTRRVKTDREMEMLSKAIVGDPGITQNNQRSDFGYVGDIGAFPPNLQALYQNPGGYATWDGPYILPGYTQDITGFKTDEWGALYTYSGGIAINSTGSGSSISKKIADATDDYLLNTINGTIMDAANEPPGTDYVDSVDVVITFPNGSGNTASKTYSPDATGAFTLDSIPVGTHLLRLIYTPDVDTLTRYLSVLPRHKSPVSYRFASDYFGSGSAGGPTGSVILRPNSAGSIDNLSTTGCGSNYQCVDESTSDENSTYVRRPSNSYATDVYNLDNPTSPSGTITGVTVYCRARKAKNVGLIRPNVYVGSTPYNGSIQSLTTSWSDYSEQWTTNPSTSSAWTWTEINNLQAGISLRGQNSNFPAYCTQVWVEVEYGP